MKTYSPASIADAMLKRALMAANKQMNEMGAAIRADWNCIDELPAWAGPDPHDYSKQSPPVDPSQPDHYAPVVDTRPDAKVIPLFPQPDGTRCACSTWGQASCRAHQHEVRK